MNPFWIVSGGFTALAGLAFAADYRRAHRRDLDKVGWMPWNLVQILAIIAAAGAAAFALRS